jgi:hypothetical protein
MFSCMAWWRCSHVIAMHLLCSTLIYSDMLY